MSVVLPITASLGAPMSENDLLALNSNFEHWKQDRGEGLTEIDPFLYYAVEQFLKPFDPSDEDIQYGITDGGHDGGVDSIYCFVNGRILVRDDVPLDYRTITKVHLLIMQVKGSSRDGFQLNEVNKMMFFTDDLLNLSRPVDDFTLKYNPQLLQVMRAFKTMYHQAAGHFPEVVIDYYYINKSDERKPDRNTLEAAERVKAKAKEHLRAGCNYHFINAQSLLLQAMRRRPQSRTLIWHQQPMDTQDGLVGIVKLRDYYEFIKDEHGQLEERIFEANVRGYQQSTPVNTEIQNTLRSDSQVNFWLLNNGVTIIAAKSSPSGYLQQQLEDPQIVNGLQTSREIYKYFSERAPDGERRSILVKVIQNEDPVIQGAIIKATNYQNSMQPASLRAVEPIQYQIEEFFRQYDLFYDRRKGFYKDKNKPIRKIVSVNELLQAVISILLHRPDDARARPGNYLTGEKYDEVFKEVDLRVYLACVRIMRRVESFLGTTKLDRGDKRNVKFYVAAYLVGKLVEAVNPTQEQIMSVEASTINDTDIKDSYRRVWAAYQRLGGNDIVARGSKLLESLRRSLTQRFGKKPHGAR